VLFVKLRQFHPQDLERVVDTRSAEWFPGSRVTDDSASMGGDRNEAHESSSFSQRGFGSRKRLGGGAATTRAGLWPLGHVGRRLVRDVFWTNHDDFFVAAIVIVVVLLVRWLGRTSHGPAMLPPSAKTPLDLLKERFARGEIDKEEYEERRGILEK
jgi:putative membrane protein